VPGQSTSLCPQDLERGLSAPKPKKEASERQFQTIQKLRNKPHHSNIDPDSLLCDAAES